MKIRRAAVGALVGGVILIGAPASFASSAVKAGQFCKQTQVGHTVKSGSKTLVCRKSGKYYRWVVK